MLAGNVACRISPFIANFCVKILNNNEQNCQTRKLEICSATQVKGIIRSPKLEAHVRVGMGYVKKKTIALVPKLYNYLKLFLICHSILGIVHLIQGNAIVNRLTILSNRIYYTCPFHCC